MALILPTSSPASHPFSPDSIWNSEIPATASFSAATPAAGYAVGLSSWLPDDGSSIPVYQATADSATYTTLYNPDTWANVANGTWENTGNGADVNAQILSHSSASFPYPYHTYVSQSGTSFQLPSDYNPLTNPVSGEARTIQAPEGIHASNVPDGHMVVYQPDGSAIELFGAIVLPNHTIVAQTYSISDPSLAGDGFQNGVTASMIPVYAGLIREDEVEKGVIDHAMKLVVPASMLDDAFVYPALSFDRGALTENPAYSGSLAMGAHLAIPDGVDLAGLGLTTDFGKMVAEAAQSHGFFVTDRGGSGVTVMVEADTTNPALDNWDAAREQDLQKILKTVHEVSPDASPHETSQELLASHASPVVTAPAETVTEIPVVTETPAAVPADTGSETAPVTPVVSAPAETTPSDAAPVTAAPAAPAQAEIPATTAPEAPVATVPLPVAPAEPEAASPATPVLAQPAAPEGTGSGTAPALGQAAAHHGHDLPGWLSEFADSIDLSSLMKSHGGDTWHSGDAYMAQGHGHGIMQAISAHAPSMATLFGQVEAAFDAHALVVGEAGGHHAHA